MLDHVSGPERPTGRIDCEVSGPRVVESERRALSLTESAQAGDRGRR
jgi:hypothetical protein